MVEIPSVDISALLPTVKTFGPDIVRTISQSLKWVASKTKAVFSKSFEEHIKITIENCSYIRTVYSPDVMIKLNEVYVNLYFKLGNSPAVRDEDILKELDNWRLILIEGTGGAGKSMAMRYIALQAMSVGYSRVPLFINLRDLREPCNNSIIDNVYEIVSQSKSAEGKKLFLEGMKKGGFILFLDGMDEIALENRELVRRQISELIREMPNLHILLSSRPEFDHSGWNNFNVFKLQPLNYEQSKLIIEKSKYDVPSVKESFLRRLENREFECYDSFVSVPLLLVILLMSFGEHLEVSLQQTSFYEQAYQVLYRRHDRTKDLLRKNACGLNGEQFRQVLEIFCYKSLIDSQLSFSENEFQQYLSKSSSISEISFEPMKMAKDLTETVPILYRDGINFYFIHRTFQEYFAACFISKYRGSNNFKVYDVALSNGMSDNIGPMIAEMDFKGIEKEWCKPALERLKKHFRYQTFDQIILMLKQDVNFFEFSIQENYGLSVSLVQWNFDVSNIFCMTTLARIYSNLVFISHPLLMSPLFSLEEWEDLKNSSFLIPSKNKDISNADSVSGNRRDDESFEQEDGYSVDVQEGNLDFLSQSRLVEHVGAFLSGIESELKAVSKRISTRSRKSLFD